MKMIQLIIFFFVFVLLISSVTAQCADWLNNHTVVYYRLDESTGLPFYDDALNINQTTGNEPDYTQTAIITRAQNYSAGNDDRTYAPDTTVIEVQNVSVCFWFQLESNSTSNRMFIGASDYDGVSYDGWWWQVQRTDGGTPNAIYTGYREYGVGADEFTSTTELQLNSWYHICGGFNASTPWITINGTYETSAGGDALADPMTFDVSHLTLGNVYRGTVGNFLSANEINGTIDEFAVFNDTINQTCVEWMFNNGVPTSDHQCCPFSEPDSVPPNITLDYPDNETHYNTFTGNITVNATDPISGVDDCDINDSNWDDQGVSGSTWLFNRSNTPDGNYSIVVNCTDSSPSANEGSIMFWFVVDTTEPNITINSPANNTWYNSHVWLDITYSDNYLYRTNTTIYNNSGDVVFTNYSTSINTTTYNITQFFNVSTHVDGRFNLLLEASDSHTGKNFKEKFKSINKSINLTYDEQVYILSYNNISFIYPNNIKIDTKLKTDRWTQTFKDKTDIVLGNVSFLIRADNIEYLSSSTYPCHFVIPKGMHGYWYDCEGLPSPTVKQVDSTTYKISFTSNKKKETSKSLGGLNYNNRTINFTVDTTTPLFTWNSTSSTSSTVTLSFNCSDTPFNTIGCNYTYVLGTTCTNTLRTGGDSDFDFNHTTTEIGLSANTSYSFNVTCLGDNTSNCNSACFTIATTSAATGTCDPDLTWNYTLCDRNFTINSTGYFLQDEYCGGDDNMFIAIGIILTGILFFLLFIADRFEFMYFTDSKERDIPLGKYTIWLICVWLMLPIVNVAIVANRTDSLGLTSTLGVFYKALWAIAFILSALWLLGFIFYILQKLGEMGQEMKV